MKRIHNRYDGTGRLTHVNPLYPRDYCRQGQPDIGRIASRLYYMQAYNLSFDNVRKSAATLSFKGVWRIP